MATLWERWTGRSVDEAQFARVGSAKGRDTEQGTTGTPNVGGYIVGEDYNPKLDGQAAMKVYDEMRRSDGQVQSLLLAIKLPLKSATWRVDPPNDAQPAERELADFCQACLFDVGALRDSWSYVLDHLLLKLDFGNSVLERIWTLAGDGKVRLKRLAPRLPPTIEQWILDPVTNELRQISQQAWKNGQFGMFVIDADRCVVSVNNREGDNYYGRSVLRSAYMHWFLKNQLYRIDAVKHDRYGVGVPEAILDKDETFTTEELSAIDRTLKNLSAKERAFLRHSSKVEYNILTPQGSTGGTADLMTSVEHHNAMIARTALAGFMSQGEQKHGSYGMGSRLTDFFSNALESVADDTCNDLNLRVIKPLCDLNFPMQGRRYPHLSVANISDVDVKELTEALKTLGPHITPEDDLEDTLRKLLNLPALPSALRGRDRTPKPPPPPGAPGTGPEPDDDDDPPAPKGKGKGGRKGAGDKGGDDEDDPDEGDTPASLATRRPGHVHRLSAGYVTSNGYALGRAPTALEAAIFSVEDVPAQLEAAAERLAGEMAAVRRTQLEAILAEVVRKDARTSTGDFTDIRPSEIRLPGIPTLKSAIRATQSAVFTYGVDQVRQELTRQGLTPVAVLDAVDDSRKAAASALVSSAQVSAERMSDTWYGRILETVLSERRSGKQGDALKAAVEARLADDVDKAPIGEARAEVNEAFAVGRAVEAASRRDDIDVVQYSALMDTNTCGPCAALDGTRFAFQSEEYYRTLPPYAGCDGNKGRADACRCVHLYLLKDRTV